MSQINAKLDKIIKILQELEIDTDGLDEEDSEEETEDSEEKVEAKEEPKKE